MRNKVTALLALLWIIFFGTFQVISQSSVLENLPDHGWGYLERLKNETDFPISISYEKHPTHDAMPEQSVVRIKSLDPRHGKEGKYYTVRKVEKTFFFQADGTDAKDPATLFTVHHRMSGDLKSWLGFSHATARGNMMRFDPETKTIVFDKKDFLSEDAQASHWEIIGSTIEDCYLKNRLSEGFLYNYKGKVEFRLEPDQEKIKTEQAVWGISYQRTRELNEQLTQQVKDLAAAIPNLTSKAIQRKKKDMWLYTWDTRHRVRREEDQARNRVNSLQEAIKRIQQELKQLEPGAKIYRGKNNNVWDQIPGLLNSISVRNDSDVWGTNTQGQLFHWDGKSWAAIPTQVDMKDVSVNATGKLWCVSTDNKPWIKTESGFSPAKTDGLPDEKMVMVALRNEHEIWAMGGAQNHQLYVSTGEDWVKNSPPDAIISSVSVSDSGEVWATDTNGKVWRKKDQKSWETVNCPAEMRSIAVRNKHDAWGTSKNYDIFHWDGKTWKQVPGKLDYVSVGSGVTVTKIEGKKGVREIETASTIMPDGKPAQPNEAARIKFELVKLGMGGGVPPGATPSFIKIPVAKNPQVLGFAKETIENVDASTLFKVNPLLTRGIAWLEASFRPAGRTSISFLARPKDTGDVQVVFGQDISPNYTWRIIIGGWKNTKSAIIKRRYEGDQVIDDVVCEVTKEQNPLAATFPGNFTPYWVSIDNGFILVGMGELGENVFLAWRDPQPPTDVIQVGFGSYKQPVEYTQIQMGPPVITHQPQRVFFPTKASQASKPITASPAPNSFAWSPYPFRTADDGSIGFEIQGQDQAVIALGQDATNGTQHYAITFGDHNAKKQRGLSIKRWDSQTATYKYLYFLKEEAYPAIALQQGQFKKFWISFYNGQIIVGQNELGQNPLLVCQDLGPLTSIDAVGFGAFGKTPMQVRNIEITPALSIGTEKKFEAYKRVKESIDFKGSIVIILPFEYKFAQDGQSVKLEDAVNNRTYYPGATPQQGALYSFMFTVLPNGAPKMDWTKAPENPQELKFQKEMVKMDATMALKQAQADAIRQSGVIDRSIKEAEAAKTEAKIGVARMTADAGAEAGAKLTAAGPIGAAVGIGISTASTIGFGITAGLLGSKAANQQFKGAELEAQAQRKALDKEAEAAQLAFQKQIAEGQANFAFRSHDSYVYVDQPERPELGGASIPQEAIDNKQELVELLNQADAVSTKDIDTLLNLCQNMIFKINHFYVISENDVKQRLFRDFEKLIKEGKQTTGYATDIVSLLFSAYNNSFLVNEANPDEAVKKAVWLRNINYFAGRFLKNKECEINSYFGEYVWLPDELPQPGIGTVSLELSGTNDFFICFANDIRQKIRNTDKEIYEIVLGGWDNNKAAIRIKSLGKSVKELTYDENPAVALNPNKFEKYWINVNNGLITIGQGEPGQNPFLSWQDPYPIKNLRYIGLSSWNAPVSVRNITISEGLALKPTPKSRRISVPKRVPIGTSQIIPSDAAEIAEIEQEVGTEIEEELTEGAPAEDVEGDAEETEEYIEEYVEE